jgi:hypothetical protein
VTTGRNASCAFPSWPNRSSLFSDSDESVSAYLSDEDLFPTSTVSPASEVVLDDDEHSGLHPILGAPGLTTEEQIHMMHAADDEDERRLRFLAHVQAHARAQQALRAAQLAAAEQTGMKRKKRRVPADKKRRTASSSSSTKPSTSDRV